tara:strand:- start:838 stop:1356 length:519 start_codon:yes stop_codon:yes gene_type:complete
MIAPLLPWPISGAAWARYAACMKAGYSMLFLLLTSSLLISCAPEPKSGKGLVLPEGDSEQGKQAFVDLKCHRCHSVAGIELSEFEGGWEDPLRLGGEIVRVKTYGDLITAIVYPDHAISEEYRKRFESGAPELSPMSVIIDEMSVRQLIDIVTFLHSRYIKLEPDYNYEFNY